MEKKIIFGGISILSFLSILFSPKDSNIWIYFGIIGIIFGILWIVIK